MFFDGRLNKKDVIHMYSGTLLSHKKRWDPDICNNMEGSWEHHAKQNKLDRKITRPYEIGFLPHAIHKINYTCIQDFGVKADIFKYLKENIGWSLEWEKFHKQNTHQ